MAATSSHPSSYLVVFWLCCSLPSIFLHLPRAASLSFNLSFSNVHCGAVINCTGDAYTTSTTLELTKAGHFSVGRATYAQPVPLWDSTTGELASFTTNFTFQISPTIPNQPFGDGMAFFLGHFPSEIPNESSGGNLGLVTGYTEVTGDSRIVAVEFDTYFNGLPIDDISSNHVAIDLNSVSSVASTNTTSPNRSLTSGFTMVASVNYNNVTTLLAVLLQINDTSYRVNRTIDMKKNLPEQVAVGFSASTGGSGGELNSVLLWSFSSTLQPKNSPLPATISWFKLHRKVLLPIFVLVPLLSLLACATVFFVATQRRARRCFEASDGDDSDEQGDRAELERAVDAGPRRYSYRELAAATSNFAEEAKLGRGGFGSVFQGHLAVGDRHDRPVAIKMLSADSSVQGRKEFEAEVRIISRLRHRNLVQLLGWCDSRKGLLLVYELVAEGSLDKHLYNPRRLLTWQERLQIILGLGSALHYLHGEWEKCIVHGDIKPSNIMLDSSHGTKLGDFGLARLIDHGVGSQTTDAVLGTVGYIDPGFIKTHRPSTEYDVYSFGVVLLEIVAGRRPVMEESADGEVLTLPKWAWSLYSKNALREAADPKLRGDELEERQMERVLLVGLWCAVPNRSERPSIAEAMHVLVSSDAPLPALRPQMYNDDDLTNAAVGEHECGSSSSSSVYNTTNRD